MVLLIEVTPIQFHWFHPHPQSWGVFTECTCHCLREDGLSFFFELNDLKSHTSFLWSWHWCSTCEDLKLVKSCECVEENDNVDHLTVNWVKCEKIEHETKDGTVKEKRDFVGVERGNFNDFVSHFKAHWPTHILHHDTGKRQSAEALAFKRPPRGWAGKVQDFGENLSMEPKIEHQSPRHSQVSVTLCGCVFHVKVDDVKNVDEAERKKLKDHFQRCNKHPIVREFHCAVSPDLHHDNAFVQHADDKHLTPHSKRNVSSEGEAVTSDGAPSQCKLSTHALWIGSHKPGTGIVMDWCFRGTAHGKDEVDGASHGDVKNAVAREQLNADGGEVSRMKSAEDAFNFFQDNVTSFCKDFCSKKGAGVHRRVFHWMPACGNGAADRNIRGCETLVGVKKLHQVLDIGCPGKLLVRTRSCRASEKCWKGDHSECKNNDRCGKPWIVTLKPKAHVSLRATPQRAGELGIKLGQDAKNPAWASATWKKLGCKLAK
eukprot:jgi/Bigna1/77508/fgenesh1_pg.48_\